MPSAEEIYLFRHAAYRDVAYRLQLPSDRAELHALALEIMEQVFAFDIENFAFELAVHARLAREQGATGGRRLAESEAKYVMKAVDRVAARAQWEIMVALCGQALGCPALDDLQTLKLIQERGRALRELGRISEALDEFTRLADEGLKRNSRDHQISGMVEAGGILVARGQLVRGYALFDTAEPLARQRAEEGYPEQLATIYVSRSQSKTEYSEVEKLLTMAREALAGHPDSPMAPVVEGNFANLYGGAGRHEEAVRTLRELVEVFNRRGETRNTSIAWANVGRQLLLQGKDDEAEHALGKAIRVASEVGNSRTEAFARANLSTLQMRRGALAEARLNIARAIQIARDHELNTYHAAYLCTEAELQLLLGHELDAQSTTENARAEFIAAGGEAFVVEYCGVMRLRIAASLAVSTRVPGRATSLLAPAPPSPSWLPTMHDLLSQLQRAHDVTGSRSGILLKQGISAGAALLEEIEASVREQRPALVYRGHLPDEMRPELRTFLLGQLTDGQASALRTLHPALWRALST